MKKGGKTIYKARYILDIEINTESNPKPKVEVYDRMFKVYGRGFDRNFNDQNPHLSYPDQIFD